MADNTYELARLKRASKFMSLVLRHRPELIGLELDKAGWASVDQLLKGMNLRRIDFSRSELEFLVANNDKARFAFDESGHRIRANQGHTVAVDLQLTARQPPPILFHGTHTAVRGAIFREGLRKMKRHHVHLSTSRDTAAKVGERRGSVVIFSIDAEAMAQEGHVFYRSENGVWLTDHVPPKFLSIEPETNL